VPPREHPELRLAVSADLPDFVEGIAAGRHGGYIWR
jgi:hypothetical protein